MVFCRADAQNPSTTLPMCRRQCALAHCDCQSPRAELPHLFDIGGATVGDGGRDCYRRRVARVAIRVTTTLLCRRGCFDAATIFCGFCVFPIYGTLRTCTGACACVSKPPRLLLLPGLDMSSWFFLSVFLVRTATMIQVMPSMPFPAPHVTAATMIFSVCPFRGRCVLVQKIVVLLCRATTIRRRRDYRGADCCV